MSTQYIQLKGRFQPINIIPSGQIKCFVCNRMFPRNALDQHHNTHIEPKFLLPKTQSNNLKKMEVSQNLINDINTEDSDINVHSILPSELPSKEFQRKRAYVQHGGDLTSHDSHDSNSFFIKRPQNDRQIPLQLPLQSVIISAIKMKADDNKQITSNLGNQKITGRQQVQILPLQTGVAIPMKLSKIQKKTIQVYKNQHRSYQTTNDTVFKKKHMIQSSPLIGQAYEIIQQKQEKSYLNLNLNMNPEQKLPQGVKQSGKYKCNWNHVPSPKLLTSTKSFFKKKDDKDKNQQKNKDKDDVSQTSLDYMMNPSKKSIHKPLDQTRIIPIISPRNKGDTCDNKCQCCGGFYCKVCNSTIPPKYRPVPTNKDKRQELDQEQVREFWNMYYEKLKNRNICKNCESDEILHIKSKNPSSKIKEEQERLPDNFNFL